MCGRGLAIPSHHASLQPHSATHERRGIRTTYIVPTAQVDFWNAPSPTKACITFAISSAGSRRDGTGILSALRTPEEKLPSGAPKSEFGRMNYRKISSLGNRTTVNFGHQRRQVLVEAPERVTPRVYQGQFWTVPLYMLE